MDTEETTYAGSHIATLNKRPDARPKMGIFQIRPSGILQTNQDGSRTQTTRNGRPPRPHDLRLVGLPAISVTLRRNIRSIALQLLPQTTISLSLPNIPDPDGRILR